MFKNFLLTSCLLVTASYVQAGTLEDDGVEEFVETTQTTSRNPVKGVKETTKVLKAQKFTIKLLKDDMINKTMSFPVKIEDKATCLTLHCSLEKPVGPLMRVKMFFEISNYSPYLVYSNTLTEEGCASLNKQPYESILPEIFFHIGEESKIDTPFGHIQAPIEQMKDDGYIYLPLKPKDSTFPDLYIKVINE